MKKYIPLELSLAQRLAAAEPETRFCGFCRTEPAAVEELKEVMAKPAAELLFSPSLAHLEELEKKQGFGTADVCDPLDKAVLSAQMPGPAPAADGPNRQLMTYAMAASGKPQWECPAEPVGSSGKVYHPLHNIAEWRKGCSCATGHPSICEACTEGLVVAIENWFAEQQGDTLRKQVHDLTAALGVRGDWASSQAVKLLQQLHGPLSPTGRLPSQPALHDEPVAQPDATLVSTDFSALEERVAAHFGTVDECDPLDKAVLSAMMPGPAPAEDGPDRQLEVYAQATRPAAAPGEDYRTDGDGIWLRRAFLSDILQRTGKALGTIGTAKLLYLPDAAQKLRDELEQAQATIKEMGELIDQQAAELKVLRGPLE